MQDYSKWKGRNEKVVNLQLDPLNPRIPNPRADRTQPELIAYLVENDNVYDLAKKIVTNGFLPTEIPVVVREDVGTGTSRLYVLEGNRRITALKALESPECVPAKHQAKFRKLAATVPKDQFRNINVVEAPDRDAATPLLLDRHTTTQVHKWTRPQQAAFYYRLYSSGQGVEDIAKLAGTQPGDVREILREDALYRAACALDLDEETKAIVTNPNKFKLTNLARPFGFSEVREAFGIEFHEKDLIRGKIKREEFERGFKRLVTDVAKDELDSRILSTAEDAKKYLKKLGKDRPDTSKSGRFKMDDVIGTAKVTPEPARPAPANKSSSGDRASVSIVPSSIKLSNVSRNARIREVFGELKKLEVEKFPNASALLLRTLIELALTNYLDKTKEAANLHNWYMAKHKGSKPKDNSPTLAQALTWTLQNVTLPGLQGQSLRAAKNFAERTPETMNLDMLDAFTHNAHTSPTATELRKLWGRIEPLMLIILKDPAP